MKVSELSNDELNRLIETRVTQPCPNVWGDELNGFYDRKCPQCHRFYNAHAFAGDIPDYCQDLNAVAKAEAKFIESGRGEKYLFKLGTLLDFGKWPMELPLGLHYATATARQRAEAIAIAAGLENGR